MEDAARDEAEVAEGLGIVEESLPGKRGEELERGRGWSHLNEEPVEINQSKLKFVESPHLVFQDASERLHRVVGDKVEEQGRLARVEEHLYGAPIIFRFGRLLQRRRRRRTERKVLLVCGGGGG